MTQQQDKNWWDRNWKWFVPVGCLGAMALIVCSISIMIFLVFSIIKSSDVCKDAFTLAKAHPSVQAFIGAPVEEGTFISGNININGASGQADLAIPISGPDGKATIYAVASKTAGIWEYSILVVEIKESKQRIDLLK
ncbi:MAG: hypothetical protein GY874_22120 [Desulfobacteraceae bacterium]|nr:hypothetical protein [Desulfobacteraceae bacterium]